MTGATLLSFSPSPLAEIRQNRIGYFSILRLGVTSTPIDTRCRDNLTPYKHPKPCLVLFTHKKEDTMNPLDSIPGTITAGFVLTVILYFVVKAMV